MSRMMDGKPTLLIGVPTASGSIPLHTVIGLMHMAKPLPFRFDGTARVTTAHARNLIAKAVIDDGFDYLLFIDDDNPPPEDTIEKLLEADKDIVGGVYLSRLPGASGQRTLCASYRDGSGEYTVIQEWREAGPLHRVDVAATGCMLLKRHVLVALDKEYKGAIFENGRDARGFLLNEDVTFCERAIKAGFEVWLHEDVRPAHIADPELVEWSGNLCAPLPGVETSNTINP